MRPVLWSVNLPVKGGGKLGQFAFQPLNIPFWTLEPQIGALFRSGLIFPECFRHENQSGIPHAIIRPTLVFGEGDLLLNNMAWALRYFPVFPVFWNGDYRVQPIYAENLAAQVCEGRQCQNCGYKFDNWSFKTAQSLFVRINYSSPLKPRGLRQ